VKSGTSLRINILSAGVSYSESARQKQLPVTFRARLSSILHSEGPFSPGLERKHTARFFGAARATLQTGVSQATRALTANPLDKNSRP